MSPIFRSKVFLFGLIAKFIFLFYGGSSYFEEFFIPFIDSTLTHLGQNPWNLHPPHYFPYGSVLLGILTLPKLILHQLFGEAALGQTYLSYFSIKVVLLVFDFLLLKALISVSPQRERKLICFYWLNPIIFYICYIYGQLDIVSMFFAILSLIFLARNRIAASAIFLSMAILCKFHTAAISAFMVLYIWNTSFRLNGIQKILKFTAITLGLVTLGFIPQIQSNILSYISVGSPEALSLLGAQLDLTNNNVFYIGLAITAAVIARLCLSTIITQEGLFFGSGIILGALIIGSSPMPGWYLWILPFVSVFYATRSFAFKSLFVAFTTLYFLHFAFLNLNPFFSSQIYSGVTFTLLQLATIGLLTSIWISVIRIETPLIRRTRPMLIGIAGNSGSGKNSITDVLTNLFGMNATSVVEGDDYHKWERGNERWQDYTHLNPKANFLDDLASHTWALTRGISINQPHYDHSTGQFTQPRKIETAKNLIVQGLHTLYLVNMRRQFDLKIYMAPDEDLRIAWKVLRDVNQRGHNLEKVMNSIRSRQYDSSIHIQPQREMADWIVEYKLRSSGSFDFEKLTTSPEFFARHIVWNDTPVSRIIENLNNETSVRASVDVNSENINQICIVFDGTPSKDEIKTVAEKSFPHLRHLTRSNSPPSWCAGQEGLSQLVALCLFERQNIYRTI